MKLHGFPPQVFLLGAQKAGTTQLASYLAQHPEICLASPKEPDYFTQHWEKGLGWYESVFADNSKCLIDASTSYSCAPLPKHFTQDLEAKSAYSGIAERIYNTSPQAKFIYIMRDPVQRAYSAYLHQVRAGIENKTFAQSLQNNTYYMRTSHYAGQLDLYLEYFPISQFKFVFFEDFIRDPHEEVKKCFEFLALDPTVPLHQDVSQNKSFVYKGKWQKVNRLLKEKGGMNKIIKKIKPLVPDWLMHKVADTMITKPDPIPDTEKAKLEFFFQDANKQLKSLIKSERLPWE
jgi:hypothetical protein